MVIRRQNVTEVQKAPAANDNLPTLTPPPSAPSARLLKGECIVTMGAMTAESVDLVITSPPYLNIGMPYGDTFATIEDYIEFSRKWITAAACVLKPGGAMWINVGMHKAGPNSRVPLTYYLFPLIAGTGLTFVQEIVWDRRAQQNTIHRFSTRSERWVYLVKPGVVKGCRGRPKNIAPTFNLDDVRRPSIAADKRNNPAGANPADIWDFTQVHGTSKERTSHPCPFPQAMIERIVLACSNPGDLVLDPFGGSGTTGAAAMAHGRSTVMIEREATYWPIIEERLGLEDDAARLLLGETLARMADIADQSIDLIGADLPYGCTRALWDEIIPMEALWAEYRRILKPTGTIVLTSAGLFSAKLMMAAPDLYKYSLVWEKTRATRFIHAKSQVLMEHEDVLVFSKGGIGNRASSPMTYNPQGLVELAEPRVSRNGGVGSALYQTHPYRSDSQRRQTHTNYPRSVLRFPSVFKPVHPTQKPVELFDWIVRTYSNPGDVVLDNTMGSGTTGCAAVAAGRKFIGIERDPKFFQIAKQRIEAVEQSLSPDANSTPPAAVEDAGLMSPAKDDIAMQAPPRDPLAINVIHGDCLTEMKKMADGSVDIIVTSPPYNLGEGQGGFPTRKGKWKTAKLREGYDGHDDAMAYDDYVAWQKAFLLECWRLIPEDGAIFYQHKNRVQNGVVRTPHDLNPDLPLRQIIVWDRGSGMNFNRAFATPSHEVIYVFAKPKFRFRKGHGLKDVIKVLPDRGNPHPAPFPVELPRMLIAATYSTTVCDPFCGSGSTGLAALMEGRRFVGIEQSADYCRMAEDRLGAMRSEDREKVGLGDNDNIIAEDMPIAA
ncbi:DNA-methyltransferase [Brevundimonas sp. UBA7664]|uniref:DNA-methyltransferase n=1 Tax=Brevundimonas sp. UBA7664 TaxID=1946141 RepID=UPI0025C45B3B|nr:site-specific DNA-methyltransferase [Brevundimonas sp. UBA7664]